MPETVTNEVSLFQSSLSFIDSSVNKENCANGINKIGAPTNEHEIFERLNELRKWQESQQQILVTNQLNQQEMLRLEKRKLYELFGMSFNSEQDDNDDDDDESDDSYTSDKSHENDNQFEKSCSKSPPAISPLKKIVDFNREKLTLQSPPISHLNANKIVQNIVAIRSQPSECEGKRRTEENANVVKRPFLKRGEGLKNRFKISPDAFRLDNLPKYKYARRRMQTHALPQPSHRHLHKEDKLNDTITSTKTAAAETPPTTVALTAIAGEGHQKIAWQQNHANKLNVNVDKRRKSTTKGITPLSRPNPRSLKLKLNPIEVQSRNPGPDSKRITSFSNVNNTNISAKSKCQVGDDILSEQQQRLQIVNPLSPTTKFILDTPIRRKLQYQQDEINELERFEQLERQNLSESDAYKMAEDRQTDDLLLQFRVGLNLLPKKVFDAADDGREIKRDQNEFRQSFSSDSTIGDESKHVHFASEALNIEETPNKSIAETITSSNDGDDANEHSVSVVELDNNTIQNTSSPNDKSTESFRKFKEKLFDRKLKQKFKNQLSVAKDFEISDLTTNKDGDYYGSIVTTNPNFNTGENEIADDLQIKSKLMQERLLELEMEIQSFRDQNAELTKLIREHEVIRLTFDEERMAAQEKLEDERTKFEMYMHDEQMKLLNERADLDRRAKELQRPTRSERDEIVRLREQCANHESELSTRDQKHVAAQARIRAQLKAVEKDFKELRFEVDNLKRENSKLEVDNIRLRRQGTSKMLEEINRNIAKLASNRQPNENGANNNNNNNNSEDCSKSKVTKQGVKRCSNRSAHKTVVAKVTSHRDCDVPQKSHRLRSKSVPNLQQHQRNTEKYSYSTSSPTTSDAENECEPIAEQSNYFPSNSKAKPCESNVEREKCTTDTCRLPESTSSTSKRVIVNADGSKDIWYQNGNLKKISADGMCIRMLYFNKDIKETNVQEGTVKYYYAETNTWHTTYLDGLEILEFPNCQTEHRYKDGTVEIHFPNGSVRITNPQKEKNDGIKEEWKYPDGTNVIQMTNGERLLLLPNGQREVHANGHKRREYPDGTVKIVYPDGSQESRYFNGRVRLKDKDGKLIMDSETISI